MRPPASGPHAYRLDIDGLRAFAVSSVVLYHASPRVLTSGYVGVDVFFVISGYLIGGIIYRACLERRFSFADFYVRRARRILPALIVVVTFVALAGLPFFSAQEAVEFSGQAILALLGAANVYFWMHTDYFATQSSHEPLLMTWSLGVEEQFYLFFPFVMLAVSRLQSRARRLTILALAAISFAVSIYITRVYPVSAFYMLPPRVWELALGAALAMWHHDGPGLGKSSWHASNALSVASFVLLATSFVAFDDRTPFPGWAAALPVIATLGLLHTPMSMINRRLLGAGPLVLIGQISYSWYLWHWPLMAFARRAAHAEPSTLVMLAIAALSFCLALLSWRFVERPFRQSGGRPARVLAGYALAVGVALALPVAYKLTAGLPWRLPAGVLAVEAARREGRGDCLAPYGERRIPVDAHCAPAGAAVVLLGDSHASALGPGLLQAARVNGHRVLQLSKSACPPLPGFTVRELKHPAHADDCIAFMRDAVARVVTDPAVRTVVVAAGWPVETDETRWRAEPRERVPAFTSVAMGLAALAAELRLAGKEVVVVADAPQLAFNVPDHLVTQALPLRFALARTLEGDIGLQAETLGPNNLAPGYMRTRDHVASVAKALAGVTFFDLGAQFCLDDRCRFASGGIPAYYDASHLSAAGSRLVDWSTIFTGPAQIEAQRP